MLENEINKIDYNEKHYKKYSKKTLIGLLIGFRMNRNYYLEENVKLSKIKNECKEYMELLEDIFFNIRDTEEIGDLLLKYNHTNLKLGVNGYFLDR